MGVFGEAVAAAGGSASLREAAEARRRTARATRRRVGRLIDRGEAAENIDDAALAVAFAMDRQRTERQAGPRLWAFFVVMVVAWLGFGVSWLVRGQPVLGVFFCLAFAFGVRTVWVGRARRGCAARAEAANRAVLEAAGRPYQDGGGELVRPPLAMLVLGVAILFVYYVLFFGAFVRLSAGEPLTFFGVVAEGLLFGVLMSAANLVWARRRNLRAVEDRRSARRPTPT